MRILVLSNLYPPAAVGGYERLCHDVVARLRGAGHTVTVLTTTFGGEVEDADRRVHRRLGLYWDGSDVVCPSSPRRFRLERRNQRELAALLESFRPDVVSVWGMGGLSLGLLATLHERGLPLVHVVGDDWLVVGRWSDCWTRGLEGRPRLRALARALGAPDAPDDLGAAGRFCFVSDFTLRQARAAGLDPARAQVIPAGLDPSDFPPARRPEERPWRWRLLCAGRLVPRKGFDTAIRALARLPPEATLTIVGAGPQLDALARLAREAGVAERVSWTRARRSEMAPHYRDADALVFPSAEGEAFGLVPLEAMACATPVVATGAGGSAEFLVPGANCLRFPPGDDEALAAALARLAADAELRRRLVAGGLVTAGRLTVDRTARELEAVHRAAVA